MQNVQELFHSILVVIQDIELKDIIDILLISFIIYKVFQIARETRAEQLIKGIFLLIGAYLVVLFIDLRAMQFLLGSIISSGVLAFVVLFQPEIRRVLERAGRANLSKMFSAAHESDSSWEPVIPVLVQAVDELSKSTTGALIVIERTTKLGEQIATGVQLNAIPSHELFGNIFFVNTPLHDGAVIMRDGKILAAACFLPKPQKEEHIASHLGSRHRAALGISEVSDSLTIVISEETGTVSIAENGELDRGFSSERLTKFLRERLLPKDSDQDKKKPFSGTKFFKGAK